MDEASFLRVFGFGSMMDKPADGFGPLFCAAFAGQPLLIAACARQGANLHSRIAVTDTELWMTKGETLLNQVLLDNPVRLVEIITALIEAKTDPNRKGVLGNTPLHYCKTATAIALLLQQRASIECRTSIGVTPLTCAVNFGGPGAVMSLLEHHAEVEPAFSGLGVSPLCNTAIFCDGIEEASILLEHRADPNRQFQLTGVFRAVSDALHAFPGQRVAKFNRVLAHLRGITPLGMAALLGKVSLVALLLDAQGDVAVRNTRGCDVHKLARIGFSPDAVFAELQGKSSIRTSIRRRVSTLRGAGEMDEELGTVAACGADVPLLLAEEMEAEELGSLTKLSIGL